MSKELIGLKEVIDMSTTFSGSLKYVGNGSKVSLHAINTGNLSDGTLFMQGSGNNKNWVTLSYEDENGDLQTAYTVTSGTSINHIWETETALPYVQIAWNRTAGPSEDLHLLWCIKR